MNTALETTVTRTNKFNSRPHALPQTGKQGQGERSTIERRLVINGTHIRVRSVFENIIPLEKALTNIATRKLTESAKKQ